jgi:hypothetical protein
MRALAAGVRIVNQVKDQDEEFAERISARLHREAYSKFPRPLQIPPDYKRNKNGGPPDPDVTVATAKEDEEEEHECDEEGVSAARKISYNALRLFLNA